MGRKTTNLESPQKPIIPLRTRVALAIASTLSNSARRPDGTFNRHLVNLFFPKSSPSPSKPIASVISFDTTVDSSRNLWFRVYIPINDATTTRMFACCSSGMISSPNDKSNSTILPVMIFFHGGGFALLSAASRIYDIVCRRFARMLPAVVVSVEYRLTPKHRFPSQYDDGFDVLRYLDEHHSSILPANADLSRCYLAGDSAGANLAHHVMVRACRSQFSAVKLVGLISIQPFFGGEERTESEIRLPNAILLSLPQTDCAWKMFLPEGSNRDHYAVNVSGPNAEDITSLNYPRTLVFVAGFDPLQDWQRRYYKWLKKSGKEAMLIEYPAMFHTFYLYPELPESSQLFSHVRDFVVNGHLSDQHHV